VVSEIWKPINKDYWSINNNFLMTKKICVIVGIKNFKYQKYNLGQFGALVAIYFPADTADTRK
jgi:hypothetical protein